MFDEDEDDYLVDFLLENGYLEDAGIGAHGKQMYKMTKKLIEDFPDVFDAHAEFTNELLFSLWQKGFVEMSMDDSGEWTIVPNDRTYAYNQYHEELTEEECVLLEEILDILIYGKNDII